MTFDTALAEYTVPMYSAATTSFSPPVRPFPKGRTGIYENSPAPSILKFKTNFKRVVKVLAI